MRKKKTKIIAGFLAIAAIVTFLVTRSRTAKDGDEMVEEITATKGNIQSIISTTGTVLPKNRLEVKPPVSGRVDSISVREGEKVVSGQTLAWMSSTERAALLDAARGEGAEALAYWENVYKAIPLISPMDGEVIVSTIQPGQTVSTSDAIVVLSDKLIVRAQVDETDVRQIKLNQKAVIVLDAYPDTKIEARVEHIYYESETVNNVTVYKVDLVPVTIPDFFRSGMNATVDFIAAEKTNVLLVPVAAVQKDGDASYCLVRKPGAAEPVRTAVVLGITDDKNYEIVAGLGPDDSVVVTSQKYVPPGAAKTETNPFMPKMPSMRRALGGRSH